MSAAGNANLNTPIPAANEIAKAVAEMQEKFTKKDKVIALVNDDQEAFVNFVELVGADNYKDWTTGAPKEFTGLALVQASTKEDVHTAKRLIAIASAEAVFADPVAKAALYKLYVTRVVNNAMDDEANPASFVTVAGCFKQKFDLDAFKFQAKSLVKLLKEKVKLIGVTTVALRQAFQSSAFAATQFPRIKTQFNDDGTVKLDPWTNIINLAKATAEKHGYDTSIFDHWLATRAVQTADTSALEFDFAALSTDLESAVSEKEEEEEKTEEKPAA